jgi:hypothetical protein
MATTLTITVNYDASQDEFSFGLRYVDASNTTWTGSVPDEGAVAFVNSGQLELSAGTNKQWFTFDSVSVQLGSGLGSSLQCGSTQPFDLASIVFPALEGATTRSFAYAWCQTVTVMQAAGSPLSFRKDPKLGLSNTTTSTPVSVTDFPSCSCTC